VLHPTNFFQNLRAAWTTVLEEGIIAEPYSKITRVSRVNFRDLAEVAAMALTSEELTYGIFELCGDGRYNREEIAQIISEVLGRKIQPQSLRAKSGRPRRTYPMTTARNPCLRKCTTSSVPTANLRTLSLWVLSSSANPELSANAFMT
jgi:uncharacterized protein YbjT (DUF2867 family)